MGSVVPTPTSARRVIDVMGTVVSVDIRQVHLPVTAAAEALDAVEEWLHRVDATFSTYRADSQISRLCRGEVTLADCDAHVAEVLRRCADAQVDTDGYFTATPNGRIDPTGLVKGWAAQHASALLRHAGLPDHTIGAGGDVVCAGEPSPGQPWRVGVADPHRPGRILTAVAVRDGAVATSGTTERGAHVVNPRTGRPATELASVTVVGPDLTAADAYATAALAAGSACRDWLADLTGYEVITVAADGAVWSTPGFARAAQGAGVST